MRLVPPLVELALAQAVILRAFGPARLLKYPTERGVSGLGAYMISSEIMVHDGTG